MQAETGYGHRIRAMQKNMEKPAVVLVFLCIIWLLSAFVRFMAALKTSGVPSIMPDEALYFQLSGSLFYDGELALRGQPVRYEYLLYPILLMPLHLLPEGVNIFRAAQLLNSLMMSAAVFPAYWLGKRIAGGKWAFFIALCAVLAPEMVMVNHLMTESITYPLLLLTLCLVYRLIEEGPSLKWALIVGGVSFLLYLSKPGTIAVMLLSAIVCLVGDIRQKQGMQRFKRAAGIIGAFLLCLILYRLWLYLFMGVNAAQETLYASQTAPLSLAHIGQTLMGLGAYLAYVPLAFLIVPLVLPSSQIGLFKGHKKQFLLIVLFSLAAMVIGTCYSVFAGEYEADPLSLRIHTRYVAAFFPVLLAFVFSREMEHTMPTALLYGLCLGIAAANIVFMGYPIYSGEPYPVDSLSLAFFLDKNTAADNRILYLLGGALLSALFIGRAMLRGVGRGLRIALAIGVLLAFGLNMPAAYRQNIHNSGTHHYEDATQAMEMAGNESLFVTQDKAFFFPASSALDVAGRGRLPVVELDDIVKNTAADGSFQSFVPKDYWVTEGKRQIAAGSTLILEQSLLDRLALASGVSYETTDMYQYAVVHMPQSGPWLHSALSGFNQNWVGEGSRFTLWDEPTLAHGSVRVYFQARTGEGSAVLRLYHGGQVYDYDLTGELTWVYLDIDAATDVPMEIYFTAEGGNVYIHTYSVEGLPAQQ